MNKNKKTSLLLVLTVLMLTCTGCVSISMSTQPSDVDNMSEEDCQKKGKTHFWCSNHECCNMRTELCLKLENHCVPRKEHLSISSLEDCLERKVESFSEEERQDCASLLFSQEDSLSSLIALGTTQIVLGTSTDEAQKKNSDESERENEKTKDSKSYELLNGIKNSLSDLATWVKGIAVALFIVLLRLFSQPIYDRYKARCRNVARNDESLEEPKKPSDGHATRGNNSFTFMGDGGGTAGQEWARNNSSSSGRIASPEIDLSSHKIKSPVSVKKDVDVCSKNGKEDQELETSVKTPIGDQGCSLRGQKDRAELTGANGTTFEENESDKGQAEPTGAHAAALEEDESVGVEERVPLCSQKKK